MSSELSLTWDDHQETLVRVFETLLDTSTLVDCTIAAEGQCLKAHKIILSACSPYFQLLFSQENEKNPIVVLKDIKFQELKAMIDFIYRGKVRVPEERLGDFVDAAESLQIKGLGSDRNHIISPRNNGKQVLRAQRSGRTSPLPHKRMRSSDFSDDRDDVTPVNVVNFESTSLEEQSHEICAVEPSSFQDEICLTLSSGSDSPASISPSVCSDTRNLEPSEFVSLVKTTSVECEEVHINPSSVVVKSEPEAMAEVYIPEMDYYIESKEEEIAGNVEVEQTEGETNSVVVTNEIPAFPAMPVATSTRQETIFVPQRIETTSSLGAVPEIPSASGAPNKHRPPVTITRVWLACDEGYGDRRDVLRRLGAVEDIAEARRGHADPPPLAGVSRRPVLPSVHKKKKPARSYPCSVCGKTFIAPSRLTRHLRTHTGERPFVCKLCGKAFSAKENFQKHLVVHTRQRPFKCDVCGKAFSLKSGLRRHLRLHTGERPYHCDQCEFNTRYSWHLPVHKSNAHSLHLRKATVSQKPLN